VHTLKGLAGLFGAIRLGAFSHRLEDLLDDCGSGAGLAAEVLDVLFSTVDAYGRILTIEKEGVTKTCQRRRPVPAPRSLGAAVEREASPVGGYELDPGMLAVLTSTRSTGCARISSRT